MLPHTAFHPPRNSPDSADFPAQSRFPAQESAQAIVFIDQSLHQAAGLLAAGQYVESEISLTSGIEVVTLDSECNGMYQISDALVDRSNISEIHLVVPVSSGQIQLGTAVLNLETIDRYRYEFPIWREALAVDAKIWIHRDALMQNGSQNCLPNDRDQALIERLSQFTQRHVEAIDRND